MVLRRSSQKKSPPHLRQTPAERAMTSAIAKMAVQDSVNADDLVQDLDKEFENELNALDNIKLQNTK